MKLENFPIAQFGIDRVSRLEEFRENFRKSEKLFMQSQSSVMAVGAPITVGGQMQHCSRYADPLDEAMRKAWEEGDYKIRKAIDDAIGEAITILLKKVKELGIE